MASDLRRTGSVAARAALACVVVLTGGCLVGYHRDVSTTGDAVVKGKLKAVEEGVTTREDVVRAFGAPTQSLKMEGGREILTYVYTRSEEVAGGVIFLFGGRSETQRIIRYNFEFRDGDLVRYWQEDMS